jgi:hypothetical protein
MPDWEAWAKDAEDRDDLLLAARYRNQGHVQQKKTDDSTIGRLKAEIAVLREENELHRKLADEYFKAEAMLVEVKRLKLEAESRELLVLKRCAAARRELVSTKERCEQLATLQRKTEESLTKSNLNNLDALVEKKRRRAAEQNLEAVKKHCQIVEMQRNAALQQCRSLRAKLKTPSVVACKRSLPLNDPSSNKKIRTQDVGAAPSGHTHRSDQCGQTDALPLPRIELQSLQPCKRPRSTLPVLMTFR